MGYITFVVISLFYHLNSSTTTGRNDGGVNLIEMSVNSSIDVWE